MSEPVLLDLLGKEFTVGDKVVYATTNGLRTGEVEWIKESVDRDGKRWYKVFIELSAHHNLQVGRGKMLAKKMGYEYVGQYFLKV